MTDDDLRITLPLIQERIIFCSAFIRINNHDRWSKALANWTGLLKALMETKNCLNDGVGDVIIVHEHLRKMLALTIDADINALSDQRRQLKADLDRLNRGSMHTTVISSSGLKQLLSTKNEDAIKVAENAINDLGLKLSTAEKSKSEINNLLSLLNP